MLGLSSHGRALIFLALFQPLLYADDVSFFRNIIVEKGAQSSGAVCIACSITVEGEVSEAVAIGGAGIASELDQLEKVYRFDQNNIKRAMLRLYQIKSDFVVLGDMNQRIEEAMFAPLQSARMLLRVDEEARIIYSLPELVPILKQKYRSMMSHVPRDEHAKSGKNIKKKDN